MKDCGHSGPTRLCEEHRQGVLVRWNSCPFLDSLFVLFVSAGTAACKQLFFDRGGGNTRVLNTSTRYCLYERRVGLIHIESVSLGLFIELRDLCSIGHSSKVKL
jgi:hypothetical protein